MLEIYVAGIKALTFQGINEKNQVLQPAQLTVQKLNIYAVGNCAFSFIKAIARLYRIRFPLSHHKICRYDAVRKYRVVYLV
jgi:hypothetical protein